MNNFLAESFNNVYLKDIKIIDEIVDKINSANEIAVIGHVEPDADCIGSELALYESLKNKFRNIDIINQGPYDNKYISEYKKFFLKEIKKDYDLYLIIDTPTKERIGKENDKIDYSKTVLIDHHITNEYFGSTNWVDDNFISTSEMVFLLLYRMNTGLDNKNVCQHILNGIISDNGYFKHIRVDKYFSLIISYFLVEKGADPKAAYNFIFGKKSLESRKLLGLAIERIGSLEEGKILWTYITDEDKKLFKDTALDSANIFNEIMSVSGVEIGIYFKTGKDKTDISFRSSDNIDVSQLAKNFGGGGHKVASGAKMSGSFTEIKKQVLEKASEIINKENK